MGNQESVRFCYIARGSLEETLSHLALAYRLAYVDKDTYTRVHEQMTELRKMINGYISFLKQSKRGASEPGASLTIHEDAAEYRAEIQDTDDEESFHQAGDS